MAGVDPIIEIRLISGVLNTFGWELIKQTITKEDLTLLIRKELIVHTKDNENKAP